MCHKRHLPLIARVHGSRRRCVSSSATRCVLPGCVVSSVGDVDPRAIVHLGSNGYETFDKHEREWEALCESRFWEMVEEGWFSD